MSIWGNITPYSCSKTSFVNLSLVVHHWPSKRQLTTQGPLTRSGAIDCITWSDCAQCKNPVFPHRFFWHYGGWTPSNLVGLLVILFLGKKRIPMPSNHHPLLSEQWKRKWSAHLRMEWEAQNTAFRLVIHVEWTIWVNQIQANFELTLIFVKSLKISWWLVFFKCSFHCWKVFLVF